MSRVIGIWKPGEFPPWITLVAKLALMGMMAVRGADYAFGDSADTARRLSAVESAAPLHWWGAACLIAAGLGFTGIILRRATPILWAHILGAAIYAALAVGILQDVSQRADDPRASLPYSGVFLLVAVLLLAAARMKPERHEILLSLSAVFATAAVALSTLGLDGLRSATILAGVATLHLLMAIGTAARARQATLREARTCE